MICTRCGKSLREGAKFCNACGTPVAQQMPPMMAPPPTAQQPPTMQQAPPMQQPPMMQQAPMAQQPPMTQQPPKKKSTILILVLVVSILLAALLIAFFLVPKLIAGSFSSHTGPGDPSTVVAASSGEDGTVAAASSSATEEEPPPTPQAGNQSNGDRIDATADDFAGIAGTYIYVPGANGFLQLPGATTLLAPDADGEVIERDNVYSVTVLPTDTVYDSILSVCNSSSVIVAGDVFFNEKNEPCIEAQSITEPDGTPIGTGEE